MGLSLTIKPGDSFAGAAGVASDDRESGAAALARFVRPETARHGWKFGQWKFNHEASAPLLRLLVCGRNHCVPGQHRSGCRPALALLKRPAGLLPASGLRT